MEHRIRDFILEKDKHLVTLGHIAIRDATGVTRQHTTGWMDTGLLAKTPLWLHVLATEMAEKVIDRTRRPAKTIVLSPNNKHADIFGAMLGAALSTNKNFLDLQSATMRMEENLERSPVSFNSQGYREGKRFIVADVASYTQNTLQRMVQSVQKDHGPDAEIMVVCAMRLSYKETDPNVRKILSTIPVLLGAELTLQQFSNITNCPDCHAKKPLTHVFDPTHGLRVYSAELEAQERADKERFLKEKQELANGRWRSHP